MTPEIKERIKTVQAGQIPKGYKRSKVGIIPEEWCVLRFDKITKKTGRKKLKNEKLPAYSINNQIGFCSQSEQFEKDGYSNTSKDGYTVVSKGAFAYNPARINVGSIGLLKDQSQVMISSLYVCFKMSSECDLPFFEYYFKSHRFNYDVNAYTEGSVREYLFYDNFSKISVSFPPLPEQQKIAQILSTQDKVIELKEKLLKQKQLRKKYLMMQLLSGAKIISGGSDSWKTIYLKSISTKIYERNDDFKYTLVLSNSAQHGIIPQNDQFDKDIANDENIDGYYVVHKGDFVYNPRISVTAPCGPINVNDYGSVGVVSPLYTVFSVKSPEVDNIYLKHYFKSSLWHKYMKSVANYGARHDRMAISNEDFFMMPIFLPPLPEQQAIAEVLSTADKEIDLLKAEIEQEKLKKKSLMQLLLTGIVRVKV